MKLSSAARKGLPKTEFAGPGRSYPIPDRSHAANAKARAKQQYESGKLSGGEFKEIVSKANKKLKGRRG